MVEWYNGLSTFEQVYFWIALVASVFLVVQIILLCFSSFGGDVDLDGDGEIDVAVDSGVSLFTTKSLTAFLSIGGWAGLLTCSAVEPYLQWLSIIVALVAGGAAWAGVYFALRGIAKMQCNGALQTEKLVGQRATVYVSIPQKRSGRGKITLEAQGKFTELDAVTDGDRIAVDEVVEIVATQNECTVVKKVELSVQPEEKNEETQNK
ncbi:MAG: NfeD family protein [Clostridiales bacterium]|nr:NfeD family protein [Clostridiales bacterium]